jgi:quercetin dioxygenase-like cupin family protein
VASDTSLIFNLVARDRASSAIGEVGNKIKAAAEKEGGPMFGRSHEAKARTFSGVNFDVLVTSSESMVTKMKYKEGDQVPFHSHPNVQSGYVMSGRMRQNKAGWIRKHKLLSGNRFIFHM